MTVISTSDHKEKHTREKEIAQLVNASSRLQFGVGDFQELWELVASGRHLQSNRLSRSFCRTGVNHANMQMKFSIMFFWLFSMAGSTVSRAARDRSHVEETSITQLLNARSGSLLGVKRCFPDQTRWVSVKATNLTSYDFTSHSQ